VPPLDRFYLKRPPGERSGEPALSEVEGNLAVSFARPIERLLTKATALPFVRSFLHERQKRVPHLPQFPAGGLWR
jgi:hypothetical protein